MAIANRESRAIVDDTSPILKYEGDWTPGTGPAINNVFPLDRTLHTSTRAGSSIQFDFEGTTVGFFATINAPTEADSPSYTCRVDGVPFGPHTVTGTGNRFELCSFGEGPLLPGKHTVNLTLDALPSTGTGLQFDNAFFEPHSGTLLGNIIERLHIGDSRVSPSPDWRSVPDQGGITYSTNTENPITFQFEGTSAAYYGAILTKTLPDGIQVNVTGKGSYTLDNGTPNEFTLPAFNSSITDVLKDVMFFNVSSLSSGSHRLVVQDAGEPASVPLTFMYFEVQNVTSAESSNDAGAPVATGTSSSQTASSSRGLSSGAIAGIVVGVLVVLALFAAGIFFFLCRRRRARGDFSEKIDLDDSEPAWNPPPGGPAPSGSPPTSYSQEALMAGHGSRSESMFSQSHDGSAVLGWNNANSVAGGSSTAGAPSVYASTASSRPEKGKVSDEPLRYVNHTDSGQREGDHQPAGPSEAIVEVPPNYQP